MSPLQNQMLKRLSGLRQGVTICPGRLARDCGTALSLARADLVELAEKGKVVLSQGGKEVALPAVKGPFRVRLR